jgi:hypothetical protein
MRMTDERRAKIMAMAEELAAAEGKEPSAAAVWARVHGHRPDVQEVMRERKAAQEAAQGGVAVLEEEPAAPAETSAAELAEDLVQLESAYESWHASLEQIWTLEQDGPLDLPTFSRARWLEYQLTENLKQQETLRPQLELARTREAVYAAQAQHDAMVPEVISQAEEIIATLAALGAAVQTFVASVEAQTAQLFPFRDVRGHQAFDLHSGREEAVHLLQRAYPIDYRASDLINLLLDAPITMGQGFDALEGSPRFQEFSQRAVERYLATLTPEGVSHASHA